MLSLYRNKIRTINIVLITKSYDKSVWCNFSVHCHLFLLVLSSFFAFPLGYAMMKHWLENYIKQTPMEWWLYAVIFIGMGLVIFLSIIWRVWKAARQNPAEVLKSE